MERLAHVGEGFHRLAGAPQEFHSYLMSTEDASSVAAADEAIAACLARTELARSRLAALQGRLQVLVASPLMTPLPEHTETTSDSQAAGINDPGRSSHDNSGSTTPSLTKRKRCARWVRWGKRRRSPIATRAAIPRAPEPESRVPG